jgi:hypothetical protein
VRPHRVIVISPVSQSSVRTDGEYSEFRELQESKKKKLSVRGMELCSLAVRVEQKINNNRVMPLEKELRNNEAESLSRSIAQASRLIVHLEKMELIQQR